MCTHSPLWFPLPQCWRLADGSDTALWWRRCSQHPSGSRRGWACERPPWSATPEQVGKESAPVLPMRMTLPGCVCVCASPFPQTPHTETRCRCTWSSSGISPAACWGWLTTQTVCKQRTTPGDLSGIVTFDNNALSLTCPLQKLVRPVATAQCWKTRSLRSAGSLSVLRAHTTPGPWPFRTSAHLPAHFGRLMQMTYGRMKKWWLDSFHANPDSPCFSKLHKAAAIVSPEWDLDPPVVVGLPPIQALHRDKSSIPRIFTWNTY